MSRSAAERGEEDIWGDWRGTIPQRAQAETPCGACGEHIIERQWFAFSGWIAHMERVVENVQGASDRVDNRLEVAIEKEMGRPVGERST